MVSGAEVIEGGCGAYSARCWWLQAGGDTVTILKTAGCGCRKYWTLLVLYLRKTVTGIENYWWLKVLSILFTPGCTVLNTDSFRRWNTLETDGCRCWAYWTLMAVHCWRLIVAGAEDTWNWWLKVLSILVTPGCTVLNTDSFRRWRLLKLMVVGAEHTEHLWLDIAEDW
jgi:hypothetical protein